MRDVIKTLWLFEIDRKDYFFTWAAIYSGLIVIKKTSKLLVFFGNDQLYPEYAWSVLTQHLHVVNEPQTSKWNIKNLYSYINAIFCQCINDENFAKLFVHPICLDFVCWEHQDNEALVRANYWLERAYLCLAGWMNAKQFFFAWML